MKNDRLFSLDLLRGLDMFLLTVLGPVLVGIQHAWKLPSEYFEQLYHVSWEGFRLWDLIMPLFIFMCGAAIPFALPKRLSPEGRPTAAFWKHVLGRVALLWVLGLVAQGYLLKLDADWIYPYSNTLQTIAAGYLIAALTLFIRNKVVQVLVPFVLAAVYGVILATCGDMSVMGNAAMKAEIWVLRHILPATSHILPTAKDAFGATHGYTWWLTTLVFGTMSLLGMQSTQILLAKRGAWWRAGALGGYGAFVLALGFVLEHVFKVPCVKHIFTVSCTFQAVGWSMLALAACFVLTDIWKFRRGTWILILYGQFALWAYVFGEIFRGVLQNAAGVLVQGFPHLLGTNKYQSVLVPLTMGVLLTLVLVVRRRLKESEAAKRATAK